MADQPKSWQSRIAESTDKLAQSFVESISYDRRLYKQDIAGSIAHATMLAKVGLITDQDRDAIIAGLKSIESDIEKGNFTFDESLEDIHMVIEDALIKRIGEPGKKLHTGRSRNDQVALDMYLWLDQFPYQPDLTIPWGAINQIMTGLEDLERAFLELALRQPDVIIPAFTHLQRAQPILAAAECAAWGEAFEHCGRRFHDLFTTENPLGSGVIAGTSLPIDRQETCEALSGQNYPSSSSIFSTSNRDQGVDFVYACAMAAQWLSRWAEQWIIYSSTEFSFIKIADRYTTGSSMMPQKRNPDMLELIRGRCGNVYGDLFALMTILKGLPIGYNRDLQEDKRIVFRAYDTVSSCLTMAAAIVNSANFIKENIEPTLEKGFLDATSLAEYLVTKSIPFRTAHQIVGKLVALCEKTGKTALAQLSVDQMNGVIAAHVGSASRTATGAAVRNADPTLPIVLDADVYNALGARNVVKRYQSAGAAGGKPFEEQLAAWKQRLGM